MNLEKLKELDLKKEQKINKMRADIVDFKKRVDEKKNQLSAIALTSDEKKTDALVNEIAMLEAKINVTEETVKNLIDKKINAYTDEDVYKGFNDYAAEYEKLFYKVRVEYIKHLDEAFDCYKRLAELRREAKQVRNEYARHITNAPGYLNWIQAIMPLSTITRGNKNDKEAINFSAYYPNLLDAGSDNSAFSD